MIILEFIQSCARLHKAVSIVAIGNLVSVTKEGSQEPDHIVECSSCENAEMISSKLDEIYNLNLA